MYTGRVLSTLRTRASLKGSFTPILSCSILNSRAKSSFGATSGIRQIRTDLNLIGRRFFQKQNDSSQKKSFSSVLTKAFAAIGALMGIGVGALYSLKCNSVPYTAFCQEEEKRGSCIEQKCEDSPCLHKHDCEEEKIIKANNDLEKALRETKGKAMEYTEAAMKAFCEAIEIVQEYLNQTYCVLENDKMETPVYEETWCCIFNIAKKRCEKVKDAIQKGQCAWELLCRLREIIEAGKACRFTSCNPLLVTAEESLICAERELLNLKCRLDCVASEHEMVEQFKDTIETFRNDLRADLLSVPEAERCPIQFVEQEVALMIDNAYLLAIRAHKEMAQVLVCQGRVPEKQREVTC